MTREEKKKGLYSLKEYFVENPIELEGHESLPITLIDYAIEALEQESVLDKIKTEIMDFEEELFHRPNTDYSDYAAVRHCLEIIDKYKEESEE